jgi:hypothetical protein
VLLSIVFRCSNCIQGSCSRLVLARVHSSRRARRRNARKKAQRNEVDEQAMGKYSEVCFTPISLPGGQILCKGPRSTRSVKKA